MQMDQTNNSHQKRTPSKSPAKRKQSDKVSFENSNLIYEEVNEIDSEAFRSYKKRESVGSMKEPRNAGIGVISPLDQADPSISTIQRHEQGINDSSLFNP